MNKTQKMLFIAVIAIILGAMILFAVVFFGGLDLPRLIEEFPLYNHHHVPFEVKEETQFTFDGDGGEAIAEKLTDGVQTFDAEITSLDLQDLFCEMNIISGSGDRLSVECNSFKDGVQMQAAPDGTLHISGTADYRLSDITDLKSFYNLLHQEDQEITITVPQNWSGDISISGFAGELNINGINIGRLQADVYAGALDFNALSTQDLDVKINTGELTLDQVQTTGLQAEINIGSLELHYTNADNAMLKVDTGSLEFEGLDVNSLQANVSVGDVEGRLVGSPADYTVNAHTSMGECELPSGGSGARLLDIQVAVGAIEVDFAQ